MTHDATTQLDDDNNLNPAHPTPARPHVVIVGGGFGGLNVARGLADAPVSVTVIDRRNHHLFQPLLYQVATGGLSPGDIAEPIRTVLNDQDNTRVLLGEVDRVEAEAREVVLSNGRRVAYDALVIAAGARSNYFGNDGWQEHAPGLKSLEDAVTIRRRFLLAFERAEQERDPQERAALLTFVIVGAGPTGVELAGTMAEMSRHGLPRDFSSIEPGAARVILVEGMERVLGAYREESSQQALEALEERGVEVRLGEQVTGMGDGYVEIGDERLRCENVVWAAGVEADGVTRTVGAPVGRGGRLEVEADCSLPGHPEIFAIGDAARLVDAEGAQVPWVAQGAIQMGRYVARAIQARLRGEALEPFVYKDKGQLATIGRADAVAEIGSWNVSGFGAWLLWLVVHVAFLIGFDNKLTVMLRWAWEYVTYKRGARLITSAYQGYPGAQPALKPLSGERTAA